MLPKNPRLSVCMIVRDEEKMLPLCLKSVQNVADELIVVDTGSRDNTISIAKDFGAKVFHFKWCDDFAAARNESLKHATGDWILQIDADEKLSGSSVPLLKKAMLNRFCLLYLITCDYGVKSRFTRFCKVGRFFRNHPRVRYSRPYHETIRTSVHHLIKAEPRWQILDKPKIIIHHYELSEMERIKKLTRGLRMMEAYIEKNPDDAYILTKLGEICCVLERYKDAEKHLRKAMEIDPGWLDTKYSLGLALQRQGKIDVAIEFYKKVLASDSHLADAHSNLGVAYRQKGMVDEAISELRKALDINPDLAETHSNLGVAYGQKGMVDEAISELRKALDINPDLAETHSNLGVAYVYKGMLDEAVVHLKKAIAINPDYAEAHNSLAVAYYFKKKYKLAIGHCDKAISLGHRVHPDILHALSRYR